jgi:hypothetical protein
MPGKPLTNPSTNEIQALVQPVFGSNRPSPSDLLDLWLHLPVIVRRPSGSYVKYRSTLEACLAHCRIATNRGADGVSQGPDGDWLGATAYLMLLDLIGISVRVRNPARSFGNTGVLRSLAEFTDLDEPDALCIYALRNSLAHTFSLANVPPPDFGRNPRPKRRRQLTHLFRLTTGSTDLIDRPSKMWRPARANIKNHTTIDVKLLGDTVEEAVRKMRSTYQDGDLRIRTGEPNTKTPAVWRCSHFFQHSPAEHEIG